jgi:hypothetical protein
VSQPLVLNRGGSTPLLVALLALPALASVFLFVLAAQVMRTNVAGGVLFLVVGLLPLLPALLVAIASRVPPGDVTAGVLTLRSALPRKEQRIDLRQIAAVGLVFRRQSRVSAWIPTVWLADGTSARIPIGNTAVPSVRSRGPLPEWSAVADTHQGRLCVAILDRARVAQNDRGPITADAERYRGADDPKNVAYWSSRPELGVNRLPTP